MLLDFYSLVRIFVIVVIQIFLSLELHFFLQFVGYLTLFYCPNFLWHLMTTYMLLILILLMSRV